MIFLGDIGTEINIDVGEDISAQTELAVLYEKPDGTTGQWTGTISGTEIVQYTTVEDDIDQAGTWRLQAYIKLSGGWSGYSTIAYMTVESPISV